MNEKQKKFLLLRADGLSFDNIAKEIKVTKKTLIQWSRIYKDDINDLQFQTMRDLKEQYSYSKQKKYEQLLKHLQKIDEAIEETDLKTASIKDLLLVRNDLNFKLEQMEKSTKFTDTNLVSTCSFTGTKEAITVQLNEL